MKTKYIVSEEIYYDPETEGTKIKDVKTFKNEREALDFYQNPKMQRQYRNSLSLRKVGDSGIHDWNDHESCWVVR